MNNDEMTNDEEFLDMTPDKDYTLQDQDGFGGLPVMNMEAYGLDVGL